jgi:hypothetical protein
LGKVLKSMDHGLDGERSAGVKRVDKTTSPAWINVFSFVLALFVAAVFFVPYALTWGSAPLLAVFDRLLSPFLLVLALSILVHEALHGLGYTLLGRVPWREVEFGVKGVMVYAHCQVPIAASAYRAATAAPGVILGVIPGLVGIAWGNAWLTVYGALMVIAALGDLIILWLVRSVPGEARVQDHPSAPGCQVLLE